MALFSPSPATTANLEMSDRAKAFFRMNWLSPEAIGGVLMEAAKECTGTSGVFAQHFNQGQSQWPAQSESWTNDPRKAGSPGAGKKFFQTGKTFAAITQDIKGGVAAFFGSSGDVYSDSPKKIQFTSKGMFVRISSTARGASLIIGFAGKLKYSRTFNKAKREGRKLERGERKFELKGSVGFTGTRGKSRFISVGKDNIGYANILQTGEYLGQKKNGTLFNPKAVAASKRRMKGGIGGTAVYGKKMPLLPAKASDARRLQMAIERGVLIAMSRSGVTGLAVAA